MGGIFHNLYGKTAPQVRGKKTRIFHFCFFKHVRITQRKNGCLEYTTHRVVQCNTPR